MSVYFDASVIVSMLIEDAWSARADAFIVKERPDPIVSDFTRAEVASAIAAKLRRLEIDLDLARVALARFDQWRRDVATDCELTASDIATAEAFLRRLDLPLKAPDALQLALASRLGVSIATFGAQLATSSHTLGVAVAPT